MACRPPDRSRPALRISRIRRSAGLAAIAAAGLLLAAGGGCHPDPDEGSMSLGGGAIGERPTGAALARATAAWPFRPATMRIHPLSRVVVDPDAGGARQIEARIEFRDAWEEPCKGLGEVQVDLHDEAEPGTEPRQRWYVDLRELTANADHYEPVTRTYVLRLDTAIDLTTIDPSLRVYFLGADGTTMQSRLLLQRP